MLVIYRNITAENLHYIISEYKNMKTSLQALKPTRHRVHVGRADPVPNDALQVLHDYEAGEDVFL